MKLRGWIPTVAGRLSFTTIGHTDYPERAVSGNIADGDTRYLVCFQFRRLSDVVLPLPKSSLSDIFERILSFIGDRLFKLDGDMVFLIIAETGHGETFEQEYFIGQVFVFWPFSVWKTSVRQLARDLKDVYIECSKLDDKAQLYDEIKTKKTALLKACDEYKFFKCSVNISRNGDTEISVGDEYTTFPGYFSDEGGNENDTSIRAMATQVFYFLKDIAHKHKHHSPSTDTLGDLYPIINEDDISWRRNVLYSFYRKIIDSKRDNRSHGVQDSVGILSYARSFENICKEMCSSDEIPTFYGEHIKESIEANASRVYEKKENRWRLLGRLYNLIFIMLVGIFSYVGLISVFGGSQNISPSVSEKLLWLGIFLVEQPLRSLVLIFALCALVVVISTWNDSLGNLRANILRILNSLSRPWTVAILAIISGISSIVALNAIGVQFVLSIH